MDGSEAGGEAMDVDSDQGPNPEEAREPAEEEISLPNLTLPNSPESGETGRPSATSVFSVFLALRCGKNWRRSLCPLTTRWEVLARARSVGRCIRLCPPRPRLVSFLRGRGTLV